MDVVQGDFKFDYKTGRPVGTAAHRQMLDASIAGEGEKVQEGPQRLSWSPRPRNAPIPDMSEIPSIAKYFNRTGFEVWPAWLYHPTQAPILIEDVWDRTVEPPRLTISAAQWAKELGIRYKKASAEDRGRHGQEWVWEWDEGCLWRPRPYPENPAGKFDYTNPGHGKNYIAQKPDPVEAQNMLMRELADALKSSGGQKSGIDTEMLIQLIKAIKGEPVEPGNAAPLKVQIGDTASDILKAPNLIGEKALAEEEEKRQQRASIDAEYIAWEAKAKEAGIKIDGRWSLDKLRKHVVSELERRVQEAEQPLNEGSDAA